MKLLKHSKLDLLVVKYPHTKMILNRITTKIDAGVPGTIQVNINKGYE